MATLKVSKEQLLLIQRALDFYSRVGIGQFDVIKNHPTFERHLRNEFKDKNGKIDYTRYHSVRDSVDAILVQPINMLYNDNSTGKNGCWGIFNANVDDSCRDAFDVIQVIRHEFWKQNQELGLYDEPLILIQELIKVFKAHRDISFEKMKEYRDDFQFHEGRADA